MKPAACISILLIASSFAFAQSSGDGTDISKLVKKQIEEVKTKEQKEKGAQTSQTQAQDVSQSAAAIDGKNLEETRRMQFQIFLIVDACFAAVLFVLWRRRKARIAGAEEAAPTESPAPLVNKDVVEAEKKSNEIKEQLEQIKLTGKKSEELKKIRKSLQTDPMFLNLTGEAVGKKAKQLSISKGEIYLAARIKSKEMAGECLEN